MRIPLLATLCFLNVFNLSAQDFLFNQMTAEHKNVTGTKISLIPPKGFDKASNFFGFQQDQNGSSIMILDIPGPFSETSKGLTSEGFLSQGITVKEMNNLKINNLPAIFVTAEQNAHGNEYSKYVFAFGTPKETIIINGIFPKNLPETGREIKASILTTFYEPDKEINPFETVDFEIDTDGSSLLFAKSMSGSLMYTTDGLVPSRSEDKTSFLVTKSFSNVTTEDKKLFSLNRIKQLPVEIEEIETTEEINIDDIPGYEIVASAKDKKSGEKEKVYQVILFSDSLYYMLFGSTNNNYEKNIDQFKKIARTFKRK